MNEADLKANSHFFVTSSTVPQNVKCCDLFTLLRERRTSGVLHVALKDGGIRSIQLDEQTRITDTIRSSIRKILNLS